MFTKRTKFRKEIETNWGYYKDAKGEDPTAERTGDESDAEPFYRVTKTADAGAESPTRRDGKPTSRGGKKNRTATGKPPSPSLDVPYATE